MSIRTVNLEKNMMNKKDNLKALREHHQPYFDKIGEPEAYFTGKVSFIPKGKTEYFVGLFYNEINKKDDVYIELASQDFLVEDPERKLYVYKHNEFFSSEYELSMPGANGVQRYLIPVNELYLVDKKINKTPQVKLDLGIEDPEYDTPLESATLRDLAAILLRKPVSYKKWLNDLIIK